MAVIIIFILHYQIKQKKDKEIKDLERRLSLYPNEIAQILNNKMISDQRCELLALYDKILVLHEWPVRKNFVIKFLTSALLLMISFI